MLSVTDSEGQCFLFGTKGIGLEHGIDTVQMLRAFLRLHGLELHGQQVAGEPIQAISRLGV
ncbi:hypothetical protein D3C85_1944240 [compost metagenome]